MLGFVLFNTHSTAHVPQIYLLLSCSGVCDDLTVWIDGTRHSTEQTAHRQACIHEGHTGCVQEAGQELRNGSGRTLTKQHHAGEHILNEPHSTKRHSGVLLKDTEPSSCKTWRTRVSEERGWRVKSREASQVSRRHCSCDRSLTAGKKNVMHTLIRLEKNASLTTPCGVFGYGSIFTVKEEKAENRQFVASKNSKIHLKISFFSLNMLEETSYESPTDCNYSIMLILCDIFCKKVKFYI